MNEALLFCFLPHVLYCQVWEAQDFDFLMQHEKMLPSKSNSWYINQYNVPYLVQIALPRPGKYTVMIKELKILYSKEWAYLEESIFRMHSRDVVVNVYHWP